MLRTLLNVLLVGLPVALLGERLGWAPAVVFGASGLAIVPLAMWLGRATEELALRAGSALGALLNATFGNATEIIIALIAVHAGLLDIVKGSLAGSVISNLLFVLGLALLAAGVRVKHPSFNRTAASAAGSAMTLAVIGLLLPAAFSLTLHPANPAAEERLSLVVAGFLMIGYVLGLLFTLVTHAHLFAVEAAAETGASWSPRRALAVLVSVTTAIALMSEVLVNSVNGVTQELGWSQLFIGVIFIPLIGNAAEQMTAVVVAAKGKMDLSLGIALGSSQQVALLVAPLIVFASIPLGHPMDLLFRPIELLAIVVAVAIAGLITLDGESNWFEGAQLLIAYGIIAAALFLYR